MNIFWIFVYMAICQQSCGLTTRTDFLQAILDSYDSTISPNFDKDKPTIVTVKLHINSFDSVTESSMDYSLNALVTQEWNDPRLMFFNLIDAKYLELDAKLIQRIWVPDLYFPNEKKSYFHDVTVPNRMLHVHEDGHIIYKARARNTIETNQCYPCEYQENPTDFPDSFVSHGSETLPNGYTGVFTFSGKLWTALVKMMDADDMVASTDITVANIMGIADIILPIIVIFTTVFPWKWHMDVDDKDSVIFAYSKRSVIFVWAESPLSFDEKLILPHFRMLKNAPYTCEPHVQIDAGNFSCLEVRFTLKRNLGYYMIQIYIPSIFIVAISWVSFWLNVDAVPARISLGILTVLTMTTQKSSAVTTLPKVSYIKAIDVWMAACLSFVFAALLEFAFVNIVDRHQLKRVMAMRSVLPPENRKVNDIVRKRSPDGRPLCTIQGIRRARRLDFVSRIAFPIAFAIFIACYWVVYYIDTDNLIKS